MNRYHAAMATGGRQAYEAAIDEDVELLKHYGLRLTSVDGCIRAAVVSELKGKQVHPWNMVEISMKVWCWLRPILVRARGQEVQSGVKAGGNAALAAVLVPLAAAAK